MEGQEVGKKKSLLAEHLEDVLSANRQKTSPFLDRVRKVCLWVMQKIKRQWKTGGPADAARLLSWCAECLEDKTGGEQSQTLASQVLWHAEKILCLSPKIQDEYVGLFPLSSPEETEILPESICLNSHPGKSHMQTGVESHQSWFPTPALYLAFRGPA